MMVAGGGVAVGVLVSLAFAAAFIDITGITAALLSGAAGLFVLPYRKRKAKQEFRERTEELRDKLVAAMSTQFNTELDQSTNRIREALAPYTRFVRLEQTRMTAADIELSRIQESLDSLRAQVETIGR
jgi:DNA-binding cell septation regulator SpoVG